MIKPNLDELVGPINSPYSGLTSCGQYTEARGFSRANNTITAARLLEVLSGFQDRFINTEANENSIPITSQTFETLKKESIQGIGHIATAVTKTFPDVVNPNTIHPTDFSWPNDITYSASDQFLRMVDCTINRPAENQASSIDLSYGILTASRLIEIVAGFQKFLTEGSGVGHYSDLTPAEPVNDSIRLSASEGVSCLTTMLITEFPGTIDMDNPTVNDDGYSTTYRADKLFVNTVGIMINGSKS